MKRSFFPSGARTFRCAFAVLVATMAMAGCRRGGAAEGIAAAAPQSSPWVPVAEASRIYYDNGAGLQDSLRMAIRDQFTFNAMWAQATSQQIDPPPPPEIDFARDMLVLVAAGRMTPEDQIRVDSVSIRRERDASGDVSEYLAAVVRVTEGCRRFNTEAYPVEIVRIQRFDGEVRFIERRGAALCGGPPAGR